MSIQAQKRWDWINGFLTASLHACIDYLNLRVSNLGFPDFINAYVDVVRNNLPNQLPQITVNQQDLGYIFHLESELWGSDYQLYITFFQPREDETIQFPLQTFHFVLSFFIIERCLNLFLPESLRQSGRKGRRRYLFGYQNGLFSIRRPQLLEAMGPPFFLCANTQTVQTVGNAGNIWNSLWQASIHPSLQGFYQSVSGGNHNHFCSIIEAAFIRTRNTHIVATFRQGNKRLPQGTRAWWYDVLWKYSESIRYNPLMPSRQSLAHPFFWNRSIRWFTSLVVTALLEIIAASNNVVDQVWRNILRSNQILLGVFNVCTRFRNN